jgi:hypothetical protein
LEGIGDGIAPALPIHSGTVAIRVLRADQTELIER